MGVGSVWLVELMSHKNVITTMAVFESVIGIQQNLELQSINLRMGLQLTVLIHEQNGKDYRETVV